MTRPDDHDFQFPEVHITVREDAGDHDVESVITRPVCDFCFDTRVLWDYGCEDFWIEEVGFGSEGDWAVCHTCSMLIETAEHNALIERIKAAWEALGAGDPKVPFDVAARVIVPAFLKHRVGPRRPAAS